MAYTRPVRNPPAPSDRVRQLWATDGGSARPGLTPARVVQAAIEVADAEGLGALSMARVAERLGVSTMASYRHVRSKDALLDLMADVACGVPPADPLGAGWREATEAWVRAMGVPFAQHPWLVEIPPSGIPAGPHQVQWIEAGLRALRPTGLPPGVRMQLVGLLASHVRYGIALDRDLSRSGQDPVEVEQAFGADLSAVLDPAAFPELTEVVRSDTFAGDDPDADALLGLQILLDGIQALVTRTVG